MKAKFRRGCLLPLLLLAVSQNPLAAQSTQHYRGRFSQLYLNAENPIPDQQFSTEILPTSHGFSLRLPPFKTGRMPGTVEVVARNIVVRADGSFDQIVNDALRVKMLVAMKFKARIRGRWTSNRLSYSVQSIGAKLLFKSIDARFSFEDLPLSPSQ